MRLPSVIFLMVCLSGCAAAIAPAPPEPPEPVRVHEEESFSHKHVVQSGETLEAIAMLYDLDYLDIAQWNRIKSPYTIYPKQELSLKNIKRISDSWLWPTEGGLVCLFGHDPCRRGIYIQGKEKQAVVASSNGIVVYSGHGIKGYGGTVILRHDQGYLSAYGYNSRLLVKKNERVVQGQKLAEMGRGWKDQAMLYFEVRINGRTTDPLRLLAKKILSANT